MNYLRGLRERVSILHNDYAGCLDKKGWDDPDHYKKELSRLKEQDQLDDATFVQ